MASKGKRGLNKFEEDKLYRVLRHDEDSDKDLVCKDKTASLRINEFVGVGRGKESQYISTTASLKKAENIAHSAVRKFHKPVEIVEIDVDWMKSNKPGISNQAYNFCDEKNRDKFLSSSEQKSHASKMKEVYFTHKIPKEAVSTVRTIGGKKK